MNLVFIKLGGSLITDKEKPFTLRQETLLAISTSIAELFFNNPSIHFVIGHGSGSFGHVAAQIHKTNQGIHNQDGWSGFIEVWRAASALHQQVIQAFNRAGLPAISFPPSASITTNNKEIISWNLAPLLHSIENHLLPVIFGDVVFDSKLGGTIVSTEDLFEYLAYQLKPKRILLAGLEPGVWEDYPNRANLISEITSKNFNLYASTVGASTGVDVTGGMKSKVEKMLKLVKNIPGLEVVIFSGHEYNGIERALNGESSGTTIRN